MSSFAPIARTPIATLAALVEGFQYPNAHKAAMAAAQLGVAPTRGPSTRGHHRIVSYELNDDFENLFDHEALFFFDADCFRAPEVARPQTLRKTRKIVSRRPLTAAAVDPFDLSDALASLGWLEAAAAPAQPQRASSHQRRVASLTRQESRDSVVSTVPSLSSSVDTEDEDDDWEEINAEDEDARSSPVLRSTAFVKASPSVALAAPAPSTSRLALKPVAFLPSPAKSTAAPSTSVDARPASISSSTRWDLSALPQTLRHLLASAPVPKPVAPPVRRVTRTPNRAGPPVKAVPTVTEYKLKRRPIARLPFRW